MFKIPLDYALFMAEKEGYIDTHESKIQRVLRDIRDKKEIGYHFLEIDDRYLSQFGLTLNDFTSHDLERCQKVALTGHL